VTAGLACRRVLLASIATALAPGTLLAQAQPLCDAPPRSSYGAGRQRSATADACGDPGAGARRAPLARRRQSTHRLAIDRRRPRTLRALCGGAGGTRPRRAVGGGHPSVAALRRQTPTIPIVFVIVTDPVGQGFVESLAHPGGNITGFTDFDPPMAGKWLGMLAQIAPAPTRVAVLYNPGAAPFAPLMLSAIENVAPSFAVAVRVAAGS
jgi:hypothetical protein